MHTAEFVEPPIAAQMDRHRIVAALESAHAAGVDYWTTFSLSDFYAPIGSSWSPAEHVRHLTRSMAPLLPALRLPHMAMRVLFGTASAPSRSFDEMQRVYSAALDAGGMAGRFAPPPDRHAPDGVRRDAIMDAHSETVRGLTKALERWQESGLDLLRMPHPLLGKVTVREMMLFTLIHNQHHVDVAQRRMREVAAT
jgi:DinB superfamily